MQSTTEEPETDNKPPIMGSWRNMYILVIGWLIFLILLFMGITFYYS